MRAASRRCSGGANGCDASIRSSRTWRSSATSRRGAADRRGRGQHSLRGVHRWLVLVHPVARRHHERGCGRRCAALRGRGGGRSGGALRAADRGVRAGGGALAGARLVTPVRVIRDYSYCSGRFYGDGYLLAGDAACFIDPVFSTGVHLAWMAGYLGAHTTEAIWDQRRAEEEAQRSTIARYRAAFKRYRVFSTFSTTITAIPTRTSGRRARSSTPRQRSRPAPHLCA